MNEPGPDEPEQSDSPAGERGPDGPGRAEHDLAALEFDDFYRAEFAGLVVLATGVLGRRAGADDVAQDTMIDAHRRWERIGGYDSPRAWVRKVVVQRAMKVNRKRFNERVAHLRAVSGRGGAQVTPDELDPELRRHLAALPDRQRAAMAMHYLADCSLAEISNVLGVAEGTVKTHLHRGRAQLLAALAQSDPDRSNPDD